MITDLFSTLLLELGQQLNLDLHKDANNSCLIKFPTGLEIQFEPDRKELFLNIAVMFGSLPQGRYRENIFRAALKANGTEEKASGNQKFGLFGYSEKSDNLILFDKLELKSLTGAKLFDYLKPFAEKAALWKEALARGEIPSSIISYSAASNDEALFGVKK